MQQLNYQERCPIAVLPFNITAKFIMSPGSVLTFPWLTQVLSPTVFLQVWAIMGVLCLLHTKPCIPFTSDTSRCLPASRSSKSLPWQNPRGSHPSSGIPSTSSLPLKSEGPRTRKDISTEGGRLTPEEDLGDTVKLTWAQHISRFGGRTLCSLEPGMHLLPWTRKKFVRAALKSMLPSVSIAYEEQSLFWQDNLLLLRNSSIWCLFLSCVEVVMESCRSL